LIQVYVERRARAVLEDFNQRVIAARYTTMGGPPLITMPRDVEAELLARPPRAATRGGDAPRGGREAGSGLAPTASPLDFPSQRVTIARETGAAACRRDGGDGRG
jgi:hypothetical protein